MNTRFLTVLPALAGVALTLGTADAMAQATSAAESACMAAVNSQYGGRERTLEVVHSEFSQANSLVIVEADGERWRCLASNDGEVEDLSIEQGHASGSGHAESHHGGGETDSFSAECGVLVGGDNYNYRCDVTDHYRDGRKVRTTLGMPEQTIEIEWHHGNRVTLLFEGMTPQEATFSHSEGEYDIFFEDKTYYYYDQR